MASEDVGDRRLDGVDVVRCLALLSMYVAHTAPGVGPWRAFELSEYLTAALFALLVGVGAELARRRRLVVVRDFWSVTVRAVALVVIGRALVLAGTQVVIVLVHLGALTIVLALLARMRSTVLAAIAVLTYAVAPWLKTHLAADVTAGPTGLAAKLMDYLVTGEPYRVTTFMVFGLAGVLVTRWLIPVGATGPIARRGSSLGIASLVGAGVVLGLEIAGVLSMIPYQGSHAEVLLSTFLAVGVLSVTVAASGHLPPAMRHLLARTGAMTLTLYAAHVLWLALYARALPLANPYDSWFNFVALGLGSLVAAAAWSLVARSTALGRGPLEGVVSQAAHPWFLRGRGKSGLRSEVR